MLKSENMSDEAELQSNWLVESLNLLEKKNRKELTDFQWIRLFWAHLTTLISQSTGALTLRGEIN